MTTDLTRWLVSEVSDLLTAGSVGLYEFIWLLRGNWPDLSEVERRSIAAGALAALLVDDEYRLVWLAWPDDQPVDRPVPPGPVVAQAWDEPSDDTPYLALAAE